MNSVGGLNLSARVAANVNYRSGWKHLADEIAGAVEKEHNEKLPWVFPAGDLSSFVLWQRFEMPVFLAMALQKCRCSGDLFSHVAEIRDRALPVRQLMIQLFGAGEKTPELLKEVRELSYSLPDVRPQYGSTKFSWSVGVPLSMSMMSDIKLPNRRSAAFIRDIYDNYSIPYRLADDIKRVFQVEHLQGLAERPLPPLLNGRNILDPIVNAYSAI